MVIADDITPGGLVEIVARVPAAAPASRATCYQAAKKIRAKINPAQRPDRRGSSRVPARRKSRSRDLLPRRCPLA
jgi:hypothetical protein